MTLLDRFRTQPRHKHPDPAVRLEFVEEIPLDDRETIGAIAREDESPKVRLAAVAKLLEPSALGGVLRTDQDEAVRQQAAVMLRDIALDAFEGTTEADGVAAVDALEEVKALVEIARAATRETVALKALSRLADPHALGSVARHAASEAARMGAFAWLRERGEHAELLGLALNGDYKDTATAAVDLVSDRAELEQIAARGKNKSAVKRARTVIREADERQAAGREARGGGASGTPKPRLTRRPHWRLERRRRSRLGLRRSQAAERVGTRPAGSRTGADARGPAGRRRGCRGATGGRGTRRAARSRAASRG